MQQPSIINQRYRVIDFLGSGGFGETFLVEDLEMPSKRRCVLKCLKPIIDDAATYALIQKRFLREATLLETLGSQHPNIPNLYAYFQKDGRFYLVQEWIDGRTLLEFVQTQGPMADHQVRAMLDSLLATLEYVHHQQIIHRDIKPDNIILRSQDLAPVLLDFGAVKEAMGTVIRSPQAAKSTMVVGTPGFMPSEQSIGRPVYSSDLYALGLTAIYALTRRPPDSFASDPATGKLLWHREVPTINPGLAAVIDQSIEPYAPHRFASAYEMRAALAAQSPVPTGRVSPNMASQVATVVAAPQYVPTNTHVPPNPYATEPRPRRRTSRNQRLEWPQVVLMGGIIGGFIFLGLVVPRLPLFSGRQPDPSEETAQTTAVDPRSEGQDVNERGVDPVMETTPTPEEVPPEPEPIDAAQSSEPAQDSEPEASPPIEETAPPGETNDLDTNTSVAVVENLYGAIAAQNWAEASAYFSATASPPFDPNFFQQFEQVSVSNLRVASQTDSTITLTGENTYVWPDGSTQREERSYTISQEDGQALISDSAFIRMIQARNDSP
jgi:serine/threonine-protein kinase